VRGRKTPAQNFAPVFSSDQVRNELETFWPFLDVLAFAFAFSFSSFDHGNPVP